MMTAMSATFFSPDDCVAFQLDLDKESDNESPMLVIKHIDGGNACEGRHFLNMAQLRTLRDLLNEKLRHPRAEAKAA